MKLLTKMLFRSMIPTFILALTFFVMIIQLVDLFANLVRYLNLDVPVSQIIRVQLLFLPRSVSYALPIAALFSVAYTLGQFYTHNELIAVFSARVSLYRFVIPLLVTGFVLSVGMFFFQEYVVIDTYREKNELSRVLLNMRQSFDNRDVTIRAPGGRHIYFANHYNDQRQELSRVMILTRDTQGRFMRRIEANNGRWNGNVWVFQQGTVYETTLENDRLIDLSAEQFREFEDPALNLSPATFRRPGVDVEEMPWQDAREWIRALRNTGQPYRQVLTDYYSRFSLALTPLVVILFSSAMGGRFKKNILLMSLLVSLVGAVVYYVAGMIAGLMAGRGLIPPLVGAWLGVVIFLGMGVVLLRNART